MPLDISNWMSLVADSKKLSELSIPGTHDSASRYIDSNRLTTQTAGIREQLDAGIRFLDIRVGYTNGRFLLYHEETFLNLRFGPLLDICRNFLKTHPRETIIVSLKKEKDAPDSGNPKGKTFQQRFNQYVDEDPNLWYLKNAIPTLGEVRGKLVLFRRFALDKGTTTLGINAFDGYEDKAGGSSFLIKGPPKIYVQDEYGQLSTSKASKFTALEKGLNKAVATTAGNKDVLYLSFSSAAGLVSDDFPLIISNFINPKLITYIGEHANSRLGLVVMDFQTTELNTLIVRTNQGVA